MYHLSSRHPLRLLLWLCALSLLDLTSGLQVPDHDYNINDGEAGETTLRTIAITRHVPPAHATAVPHSEPQVHLPRPTTLPNPNPNLSPGSDPATAAAAPLDLEEGGRKIELKPRQGTSTVAPPAPPAITEAPSLNDVDTAANREGTALAHDEEGIITGVDPEGRTWRFRQTTYYSCLTRGATYTHCGWYRPVREAGAARLGGAGDGMMGVAARAGVAAGLVAAVLGG